MASLSFRLLDAHVIAGRADDVAVSDGRGTVSYAQLLHDSASLAAGLHHMGVSAGTYVVIDVPSGRDHVTAVLACARLHAVPHETGDYAVRGTPSVLHTPDTEVAWDLLLKAGRTEPTSAPAVDPDDYEALLRARYAQLVDTLAAGGTLSA